MEHKRYLLIQNLMYDCKHVSRDYWFLRFFRNKRLRVDSCYAIDEVHARKKFKAMGYKAGCLGELI